MSKKTTGRKANTAAANAATTSTSNAKSTAKWSEVTRKDGRVLIDPNGKVYHGTRQEIRDAALSPSDRKALAEKIETSRHSCEKFHDGDLAYLAEAAAAYRRDAVKMASFAKRVTLHGMTYGELIEAEAAARYMGMTYGEFVRDAIHAAVDAARNAAGGEIPLTRYERKALGKGAPAEDAARKIVAA